MSFYVHQAEFRTGIRPAQFQQGVEKEDQQHSVVNVFGFVFISNFTGDPVYIFLLSCCHAKVLTMCV